MSELNVTQDWKLLEFNMPISEFSNTEKDFLIRGTAITETTTRNGHKYVAEELERAAPGLTGRPLLIDHDNRVESIKGKVVNSFFDPHSKSIKFEAKIMDKNIREMISDGRLSTVSIGAYAEDLIKEEDGSFRAKGMQIVELSLVAVPADENADFTMAFIKNYDLKESMLNKNEAIAERGFGEMTKENSELQEVTSEMQKLKEANAKLASDHDNAMKELTTMRNERRQNKVSEYKKLCAEKKVGEKDLSNFSEDTIDLLIEQLREVKIVVEASKEIKAVKDITKGMVSEDISDISNNLMYEKVDSGYAFWEMPNTDTWRKLHSDVRGTLKTW